MSLLPPGWPAPAARRTFVLVSFAAFAVSLAWHAVNLQLTNGEFLQERGDQLHLRTVATEAHRGMVTDRNGEPLAISTPVNSVWVKPSELVHHRERWPELAGLLELSTGYLDATVLPRSRKNFLYLRRQISPDMAARLMEASIPGVNLTNEYRRYYPAGEVTANMLGFTNVDDRGQEGLELAFDNTLRGTPGLDRVIRDRLGRMVEHVERLRTEQPGHDLALSIDRRLQYVAYRELKAAVQQHHAAGGLMVILDARSGEVLAMVNQPSYNPNNRTGLKDENYRNRVVTDLFEPGSTIKPFTISAGLESGRFKTTSTVDTGNGTFQIGTTTVRDVHAGGVMTLPQVIQKSSNVGVVKVALAIEQEQFWGVLNRAGFGRGTGVELPGETQGQLPNWRGWGLADRVTMAFGYHTSVSAVQLARAYGVFASGGLLRPVTVVKRDTPPPEERVISETTAYAVREMMKLVTQEGGTAKAAAVEGYSVAGKTGTVKKTGERGYTERNYVSLFAGFLPASAPRLIGVVMVDNPQGSQYYGGLVAAPVFSNVMHEAVRILNIPPDMVTPPKPDTVRSAERAVAGRQVADNHR